MVHAVEEFHFPYRMKSTSKNKQIKTSEDLEPFLIPQKENVDVQKIIRTQLKYL